MTTRHEFLSMLHEQFKPRAYLEIGIDQGESLRLADPSKVRVGVDITLDNLRHNLNEPNTALVECTSELFFSSAPDFTDEDGNSTLGLVFIDGSHLIEDVWADYLGVEALCGPDTVVVFDDVLPNTQFEATREFHEGNWAGDAWKIHLQLKARRLGLPMMLVDYQPCGGLVCLPGRRTLKVRDNHLSTEFVASEEVPEGVLTRESAATAEQVISWLTMELGY